MRPENNTEEFNEATQAPKSGEPWSEEDWAFIEQIQLETMTPG